MKKITKKTNKQSAAPENSKISDTNKFLKVIADENRFRILLTLTAGQLNVTEIHSKLNLPQNLTSHHISKLKSVGLLNEKREGVFRHYSVNTKALKESMRLFKELMKI